MYVLHRQFWVAIIYDPYLSSGPVLDLSYFRLISDPSETEMPMNNPQETRRPMIVPPTTSFQGAALPPVPHKLVERIESGAFAEIGELLPVTLSLTDDELKQRSKHHRV